MSLTVQVAVGPLGKALILLAVHVGLADYASLIAMAPQYPGNGDAIRRHDVTVFVHSYIL
jgi:hypothetical protein